jgi:hypothetical protein
MNVSKTSVITGRLRICKKDTPKNKTALSNKIRFQVGNTKFYVAERNPWVVDHLQKFRNQKTLVECWIRDDGALLSVTAKQSWNRF